LPESSVQASVVIFGAANVFQGAAVDFGCAFKLVVTRQTCTNPVNICWRTVVKCIKKKYY